MAEHSELPWEADREWVANKRYMAIAQCVGTNENHENASYIVRACNSFPELVKALEEQVLATDKLSAVLAEATVLGATWEHNHNQIRRTVTAQTEISKEILGRVGLVAQRKERAVSNREVEGSNPSKPARAALSRANGE